MACPQSPARRSASLAYRCVGAEGGVAYTLYTIGTLHNRPRGRRVTLCLEGEGMEKGWRGPLTLLPSTESRTGLGSNPLKGIRRGNDTASRRAPIGPAQHPAICSVLVLSAIKPNPRRLEAVARRFDMDRFRRSVNRHLKKRAYALRAALLFCSLADFSHFLFWMALMRSAISRPSSVACRSVGGEDGGVQEPPLICLSMFRCKLLFVSYFGCDNLTQ